MITFDEIKSILPQSYPFLMIDAIEEIKLGESLVAVKNITANEWPFDGRGREVMVFPETLLIEAAAQAALVLHYKSHGKDGVDTPRFYIGKVKAEFWDDVLVGEKIKLRVLNIRMLGQGGYAQTTIHTDKKIAEIDFVFGVRKAG